MFAVEPVHLVCAHDACYRDWPWLCYVNFDAVAKFDDDAQNPVLEVIWAFWESFWRSLGAIVSTFGQLFGSFWSFVGVR